MFVNLVNTDIPFAEYQLSQDKIDAMKFRLLLENPDLEACDLTDQEEPDEMYRVFLFRDEDTLFMLVVAIHAIYEQPSEMIRLFDLDSPYDVRWTFAELLFYLKGAYERHPNKPITGGSVFPQEEYYWGTIIETLREDIIDDTLSCRIHPSRPDENTHHYEDDAISPQLDYGLDLSSEEEADVEYLMTAVMKMVFNYDYSPENDVYTKSSLL